MKAYNRALKCYFLAGTLALIGISNTLLGQVTVGMVTDRLEGEGGEEFIEHLQQELQQVLGKDRKVDLDLENIFVTNNDRQVSIKYFEKLNGSKEIDLILLLGANTNEAIVQNPVTFNKPTIGLGIFDTETQKIPITPQGTSGIPNYTYVYSQVELEPLLSSFHDEIYDYKTMGVVIPASTSHIYDPNSLKALDDKLSANHEFIIDDGTIQDLIDKLSGKQFDALTAVYFYQRSPEDLQTAIDTINSWGIPLIALSSDFVDAGMLATRSEGELVNKIVRKMALMAAWGLDSGTPLQDMGVELEANNDYWYINLRTMRQLNISLPFRLLFEAKFPSYTEINEYNDQFSLFEIVDMALENNLSLLEARQDVALSSWDVKEAATNFLPNADATATYLAVDKRSAESSFGSQAQHSTTGNITGEQLLLSHQAISNLKIQKHLENATKHGYASFVLDVINQATSLYFQLLQAKANIYIQKNNLDLSRQNLELAQQRFEIGQANESEVYRWEAEQAQALQTLVSAHTDEYNLEKNFGAVINYPVEKEFTVDDTSPDDTTFAVYDQEIMENYLSDFQKIETFTEFLITEATANHPLLKQVAASESAFRSQLNLNKMNYLVPSLAFQSQHNYTFNRSGTGSEPITIPGFEVSSPAKYSWNAAINISYPIFQGNLRRVSLQKSLIDLNRVNLQKEQIVQSIEVNISTAVSNLISSYNNLDFTQQSSESARKSLELVQASYRNGLVSVAELIDAQNSAIQTQAAYNTAYYSYLGSIFSLQYAVGRFLFLEDFEARLDFVERLNDYMLTNTNE